MSTWQLREARLPIGIGRGIAAHLWSRDAIFGDLQRQAKRFQRERERVINAIRGGRYLTTINPAYQTYTTFTITNLESLANDATDPFSSWQSARVDNQTTNKYVDYEVICDLTTANTAPANDRAGYIYLVPWIYNGSSWVAGGNFGTTTLPTGSEGTASISDPNSMKGPYPLPYKIAQQHLNGWFTVRQLCQADFCPDGWSLAFRNCTGAALSTGNVVAYRGLTLTNT